MSDRQLQAVIQACQRIEKSGAAPTTALIRAKLSQPVPLPEIIRGLKYWQSNPSLIDTVDTHAFEAKAALEPKDTLDISVLLARIETLETAVTNLQIEVQALKRQ